jgi:MFS family permease
MSVNQCRCFRFLTILGLFLIALGSGGIKPCVAAFGGEQFKMPEQAAQLAVFFSLFYFSVNAGSLISTTVTPILREDVNCFGEEDCFSLAFGVPAALMATSIVIFIAGKFLYKILPTQGNMLVKVCKCIGVSSTGNLINKRDFKIFLGFRVLSATGSPKSRRIQGSIGSNTQNQPTARNLCWKPKFSSTFSFCICLFHSSGRFLISKDLDGPSKQPECQVTSDL